MITANLNGETIAYINKEWVYEDGTKVDLEPNRIHKAVGTNTKDMLLEPYKPTVSITDTLINLITRVEKLEEEPELIVTHDTKGIVVINKNKNKSVRFDYGKQL